MTPPFAPDPKSDAAAISNQFKERIKAQVRQCANAPDPVSALEAPVARLLAELRTIPFREHLFEEPSVAEFRSWLEVPDPPPPDVVRAFARVLLAPEAQAGSVPAAPMSLPEFRTVFSGSWRRRFLRTAAAVVGAARALLPMSVRSPASAFRIVAAFLSAARRGLFDRDFYCWSNPDVSTRRFATPLLHYCTFGWREGRPFAPAVPPLPPDVAPPRESPLLLHARLFGRKKPTANTVRRLLRELRPELWERTVRERLRAESRHPDVAVVIPVYNHPELLPPLVASLLEHTPPDVQLLFVDNGSEDASVRPALLKLAESVPDRIRVECLDENVGFSGACNHGIRAAGRRDVILLNNDTVVGPRWTDSLRLAAYAEERIGTATAVSNNSGIVSVPDRGKNEMPPGLSVASVARGWLHAPETSFELHTGHGFCLYLKRSMLDDVGCLDAETFGKGYGEETDLCLRARRKGWKHRITTRAFVWHLNAVSFGGRYKAFKVAVARNTLLLRHPDLDALEGRNLPAWDAFCPWHHAVADQIRSSPPRPRILLIRSHEAPAPSPGILAALRPSFDPLLLAFAPDGGAGLRDLSERAIREDGADGFLLERGDGSDDALVSWIVEHGIELAVPLSRTSAGEMLRRRLAALHVPVLDGLDLVGGPDPVRDAARLGARFSQTLSCAPEALVDAPFPAEKTRDLLLPPEAVPGAFDPAAFDRTDFSAIRELVVDRLPLPVSDDTRLLLLARLCGTRVRIRAKTEDPRFWIDRAMPHFRLLAAADAVEKNNRPPLGDDFLPVFPSPPPPPAPGVLAKRIADYLRAKAARTAPARHVVYTAIAGGYDALKIPDSPDPEVDYVYFAPAPVPKKAPWEHRPFQWTDEDPTRIARWHKLHGPELFPDAETVVWTDGNITFLSGTERMIRNRVQDRFVTLP